MAGDDLTMSVDGEDVQVDGTSRNDTVAQAALRAAGFRWFRSLQVWGLPRNLLPHTRQARIRQFVTAMNEAGRTVTVEDSGRTPDAADRRQARDERLSERADRLAAAAQRNQATADGSRAAADRIWDGYAGQPVLLGHYSAPRHQRDLERADRSMRRAIDGDAVAADQRRRAEQIRDRLERRENPVTIKLRVERNAAQLRKVRRLLEEHRQPSPWRDERQTEAAHLTAEIDLDRAVLAELAARGETRDWGPTDFRPGDLVAIHGAGWYEVRRVNRATLSVPSDIHRDWTNKVPYAKVFARSRDGVTQTAAGLLDAEPPDAEPPAEPPEVDAPDVDAPDVDDAS